MGIAFGIGGLRAISVARLILTSRAQAHPQTDCVESSANRRPPAIDAHRHRPWNQRLCSQTKKCNQNAKAQNDRHPANHHQRQVQLCVNRAIGFIVMMFLALMPGGGGDRILAGVLRRMLQIMNVLHPARPKGQENQQEKIRRPTSHEMNLCFEEPCSRWNNSRTMSPHRYNHIKLNITFIIGR